MSPAIRQADPLEPAIKTLLEAYWADLRADFPPDVCFTLDLAALRGPEVTLFAADLAGRAVGCAAYRDGAADWGELKSMYVAPAARGSGAASALLAAVEDAARSLGRARLCLETGDVLVRAQTFYAKHGFVGCGPFGDYPDNPRLVFLQKTL